MTEIADGPEVVEVDAKGNIIEPEAFQLKTGPGKGRGKVDDVIDDEFSDDFLARCREAGIRDNAIKSGGDYRQLSKGKIYWLPLVELLEFELKDQNTIDDGEFFDWFAGFVLLKDFQTKSERTQKKTKSWGGWKSTWDDWKPQKMSSWWSSWGYNDYGSSGSDLTKRLAIALKAITTTVSVVNDTGRRYRVRLASDTKNAPVSTTSYNEQLIMISPQALLDTSIEEDTAIEITTGYGLHEASHVKYSESLLAALTVPTELRPKSIAHLLHNILEDLRIEDLTAKKFPGFSEYFVTAGQYMWDCTKSFMPDQYGPKLNDKLNAAIAMTKHPEPYKAIVDADATGSLAIEWPWWREWAESYVAGKEPIRQGVIRALEHLAEDPQTQQEMEDLTKKEEELEKKQPQPLTDEQFEDLLKQLKELLDKGGETADPCPSPGGAPEPGQPTPAGGQEVLLTGEQAAELEQLLSEQYQQFEAFFKMHDGPSDVGPVIEVSRPLEDDRSKMHYKRPDGMAERLREVFFFRKIATTDPERLLKTGFIDEEELWRVGIGDTRVFERSAEPEEVYTSVTLLVDASGSMSGHGLKTAQKLANVMMACLRTQRGVRVRVRAHTTGYAGSGETCRIYRVWEPGEPDTRIGLLQTIEHGSNFDGFAIDWCAKEMNDSAQAGEQQLLIVLSDGLPAGHISDKGSHYYGGGPAMDHMKQVGEFWGRKGVSIVQIAVDPDGIRPEDQARMFKNWIGYSTDAKLLVDLTKLLMKAFGSIE